MSGAASGLGAAVARAVAEVGRIALGLDLVAPTALRQAPGCEVRELVVAPSLESPWP